MMQKLLVLLLIGLVVVCLFVPISCSQPPQQGSQASEPVVEGVSSAYSGPQKSASGPVKAEQSESPATSPNQFQPESKLPARPNVRVVVTQDFGSQVVLDKYVLPKKDESALEVLQRIAEVETKYGGGFVVGINGIRSRYPKERSDWFFYVNGILANVGAGGYKLRPGDVEHWDFHGWGFNAFIPAIIGSFPQPFLSGYGGKVRPTVIVHQPGFRQIAEKLRDTLTRLGVKEIHLQTTALAPEKQHCHLILLGTQKFGPLRELNRNYKKLGFFFKFEDDEGAVVFDSRGKATGVKSVGVIQATQNPWSAKGVGAGESAAWMISGTDEAQVRAAADTLAEHWEQLGCAFAIALINQKIIRLPHANL